ncbi:MAG: hypothetical protein AABX59_03890 [Nanoarchaeota archaeon]
MNEKNILSTIEKLESKRKFDEGIDLIINLKNFDVKKETLDVFVEIPFPPSQRKICLFAEKQAAEAEGVVDRIITKDQFTVFDKRKAKTLAKTYDVFIAVAPVMPSVASSFGKILGPRGKMPSPQVGAVIVKLDEKSLKDLVARLRKTLRLRAKSELSIKVSIGKSSMKLEEVLANLKAVYDAIVRGLPKGEESIKSILIKRTMSKPVKISNEILEKQVKQRKIR